MTTNHYIRFREALYAMEAGMNVDCIRIENSRDCFHRALDLALPASRYAMLVDWTGDVPKTWTRYLSQAEAILPTNVWPGTWRGGQLASAIWLPLTDELTALIRQVTNFTVFRPPTHLEDLSLWTEDLRWTLGCCAHDSDLFVNRSTLDIETLRDIIIPRWHGPPRPGYTWPVPGDDGEWYDPDGNLIDLDVFMKTEFRAWRGPKN